MVYPRSLISTILSGGKPAFPTSNYSKVIDYCFLPSAFCLACDPIQRAVSLIFRERSEPVSAPEAIATGSVLATDTTESSLLARDQSEAANDLEMQ